MPLLILQPLCVSHKHFYRISNILCFSLRYFFTFTLNNIRIEFFSIQTFLSLAVLATCWSYGLAWIVSAGVAERGNAGFVQYKPDSFLFWMRFYHLFGLLWIAQFVIACQHMIIAGAVAGWYFSRYHIRNFQQFLLKISHCLHVLITFLPLIQSTKYILFHLFLEKKVACISS